MSGTTSTLPKGLVNKTITSVGEKARTFHAWMISAFDQVALLFVPAIGNSPAGQVYLITITNKPVFWAFPHRRSMIFDSRDF